MKKNMALLIAVCILCCEPVFAENITQTDDENVKLIKFEKGKVIQEIPEEQTKTLQFGQVEDTQVYSVGNTPENLKTTPAAVEIITKTDLDRDKSADLAEVLNNYSGITMQNQGSIGDQSGMRIRGIDTVSITLDGVRIDNPSFSDPYLNHMLKDGIDRIEIIKGPQGSVHGNRAQGGLVSMFTSRGYGAPKVEYDQSFGTYATFKESGSLSFGNESADFFLNLTKLDTNGGMKTYNGKVKRDAYGNFTMSSNMGKRFLDGKAEIRNTFKYIEAKKQVGISADDVTWVQGFDPNNINEHTDVLETITLSLAPTEYYDSNVKFGYYGFIDKNNNLRNTAPGSDSFFKSHNHRFLLSTQHNLKYKDINTLSFGYQMEKNKFGFNSSDINTFDWNTFSYIDVNDSMRQSYTTNDVFVNNTINLKDILIIKGGTRITNSPWGTFGTPNLSGALVLPTPFIKDSYTKFRSTYGLAVNYPTPYQLGGSFMETPFISGNLKPEKLEGYDIGVVQSFINDKVNLEFSYFDYDVRDKIDWAGTGMFGTGYFNVDKAKSNGIELGSKINLYNGLTARVNYTYTNARDVNTNQVLAAVPNNRWNILLDYSPAAKRYSLYAKMVNSSSRIVANEQLKGFFDTAIGTKVRIKKLGDGRSLYAWGQMSNLLNNRYELYPGFKSPGIRFLAGLTLKFDLPDFKRNRDLVKNDEHEKISFN